MSQNLEQYLEYIGVTHKFIMREVEIQRKRATTQRKTLELTYNEEFRKFKKPKSEPVEKLLEKFNEKMFEGPLYKFAVVCNRCLYKKTVKNWSVKL